MKNMYALFSNGNSREHFVYRFCSEYNHLFLFKLPGQCFKYVTELNVTIQNDVFIVNLKYFYSLVNSRHVYQIAAMGNCATATE